MKTLEEVLSRMNTDEDKIRIDEIIEMLKGVINNSLTDEDKKKIRMLQERINDLKRKKNLLEDAYGIVNSDQEVGLDILFEVEGMLCEIDSPLVGAVDKYNNALLEVSLEEERKNKVRKYTSALMFIIGAISAVIGVCASFGSGIVTTAINGVLSGYVGAVIPFFSISFFFLATRQDDLERAESLVKESEEDLYNLINDKEFMKSLIKEAMGNADMALARSEEELDELLSSLGIYEDSIIKSTDVISLINDLSYLRSTLDRLNDENISLEPDPALKVHGFNNVKTRGSKPYKKE